MKRVIRDFICTMRQRSAVRALRRRTTRTMRLIQRHAVDLQKALDAEAQAAARMERAFDVAEDGKQ